MYDKRFEKALGIMFQAEGGYNNLKNDYGGPTNMGITQTTFNRWRKMHNEKIDDVRNLTRDEASRIYYEMYWKASGADKQKDIRDAYILFDTAVQYGDTEAKRMFKASEHNFYKMLDARKQKYKSTANADPTQKVFIQGWLNRIYDVQKKSEQLFKEENSSSSYKEQILPSYNSAQKAGDKMDNNDYINNKIQYYMQKNKETLDSYDKNYNAIIKDITFANEDISKLSSAEFSAVEHIINNQLENNRFLSKKDADAQVQDGNLIWVDEYVRDDGTKVKGHYREKAY